MKNRIDIAISHFDNGFNCAQSVITSFCEELGIEKNMALKLACGFGGGMGRRGEICGAVTGGIIAIGAKYGKDSQGDNENLQTTYSKTRELMDFFTKKFGTCNCRKLTNDCDLTTEEGQNKFKELDIKNKICKPCVSSVVEKIEELMEM